MKIKEIQIKNFRSIENISIDFKENPRVLVGINESGKTNILEALRLLSSEFSIQKTDIRLTPIGPAENCEILFIFQLEKAEVEEIYKKIQQKILTENLEDPIVKVNGELMNLERFLKNYYTEALYIIDIKNNTRTAAVWAFEKNIEFTRKLKKPKIGSHYPPIHSKNGRMLNISNFELIDISSYPNINETLLEDVNPQILNNIIGAVIREFVNKNLPNVIYWKYDDKYLLPPSIPILSFVANPNSCVPLKNMFILAGIPENKIAGKINEAKQMSSNYFRSFLRKIAEETTKYFKQAWPEYKNIKITLELNGENIDCGIEGEKTVQDFQLRSDGFKRFVSILLLLSIPSEKKLLTNALILIDEADQSLHPSGCRYLTQQLIKIAKNNYVIYSTHSIFMIDKENIKRHYIVEKKKEITTIKEASEENYMDEEVIYRALGTSVYEILKEKNILFEGWSDKKLFEIALKKDKEIGEFFKEIGIGHLGGVKNALHITPILELAKRKVIIISDNDLVAQEKQKEFIKNKGYGMWRKYNELINRKIVTVEDFIKKEILTKFLNEILKTEGLNEKFDLNELPENGRLGYIKNRLKEKGINSGVIKELIQHFKELLFENLQIEDIEDDYFDFIKVLKMEIEKL
jgi:predicted ATP-dependent endonuclease of OLD family